MSLDTRELPPLLLAWLTSDDHTVEGWEPDLAVEELQCHPDLVERLTSVARPVRGTTRTWVDGSPVIHHRGGAPIACARGTSWLVVRSSTPAGVLTTPWLTAVLDSAWVDLDPWAADVTFTTSTELLRSHMQRAYDHAEAGVWP